MKTRSRKQNTARDLQPVAASDVAADKKEPATILAAAGKDNVAGSSTQEHFLHSTAEISVVGKNLHTSPLAYDVQSQTSLDNKEQHKQAQGRILHENLGQDYLSQHSYIHPSVPMEVETRPHQQQIMRNTPMETTLQQQQRVGSVSANSSPMHNTTHVQQTTDPQYVGHQQEANYSAHQKDVQNLGHQHDANYPGQQRNVSPVQLTELVPSAMYKAYSPPSDTNHNVTTMYAYHDTTGYPVALSDGKAVYAGVYGGEKATVHHYSGAENGTGQTYEGENKTLHPTQGGRYSVSPTHYNAYHHGDQAASYYAQLHNAFPATTLCKTYNFSTTAESGSEYSSPEMTPYTHNATASTYTPPLANAGSPGSETTVQYSPESRGEVGARRGTPLVETVVSQARGVEEERRDAHSFQSSNGLSTPLSGSSLPTTQPPSYYSDEQSLEGDSIRDIQQEILRADIERHIYENYSRSLETPYPDDTESQHSENSTPVSESSTSRKSSSGGKKRRRRMQTPVQRSAANMRERKRMCHLNVAFDHLKDRLPNVRNRKKLSRIQTLRAAMFYISLLSECVQSS